VSAPSDPRRTHRGTQLTPCGTQGTAGGARGILTDTRRRPCEEKWTCRGSRAALRGAPTKISESFRDLRELTSACSPARASPGTRRTSR
jgi:hypothetical protein